MHRELSTYICWKAMQKHSTMHRHSLAIFGTFSAFLAVNARILVSTVNSHLVKWITASSNGLHKFSSDQQTWMVIYIC